MKREEAIDLMNVIVHMLEPQYDTDRIEEAVEMAIKALKKEPCKDWHDVPSDEMTLEQARQAVKDLRKIWAKYLEQEPCEDCISRKAAQAKIKSICNVYGLSYEDGERKVSTGGSAYALGHALDDLPPIQPKTKVGKWIRQQSYSGYTHTYECSECGRTIYAEDDDLTDYPYCHCGAKMEVE